MDLVAWPLLGHTVAVDLPVPLPLLLFVAGGTVLGTSALLNRSQTVTEPAADSGVSTRSRQWTLPGAVTRAADRPGVRLALRLVTCGLLVALIGAAAVAVAAGGRGPAPRLFFSTFWVGLLLVSLLAGPVWRLANPLRGISAALAWVSGDPRDETTRPVPAHVGLWPAAVALLAFLATETAAPNSAAAVLGFLALYVLAQVGAAVVFGRSWYAHGDGFEAYSSVVGWLAPVGRDAHGRLVLRSPRTGLAQATAPPGTLAVLAVLLGSQVFHVVEDTGAWQHLPVTGAAGTALDVAALLGCVAAVYAIGAAATKRRASMVVVFVPLLVGYAVAHYAAPFVLDIQALFGVYVGQTSQEVLALYGTVPPAAAGIQLAVFLIGHALTMVAVHDRTAGLGRPALARAAQLPLQAVLLVSVVGGVALLFGG